MVACVHVLVFGAEHQVGDTAVAREEHGHVVHRLDLGGVVLAPLWQLAVEQVSECLERVAHHLCVLLAQQLHEH